MSWPEQADTVQALLIADICFDPYTFLQSIHKPHIKDAKSTANVDPWARALRAFPGFARKGRCRIGEKLQL